MSSSLHFAELPDDSGGRTKVWEIVKPAGKSDIRQRLGCVKWYGRFRSYCFWPTSDSVFEDQCLHDIADFCQRKTREHHGPRAAVRLAKR